MKPSLRKALLSPAVLLFWLGVWVLASALVGQELLLPSPLQVLRRFLALAGTSAFWLTVGTSILPRSPRSWRTTAGPSHF